jgi:molecular chaperone Hsp33
MSDDGNSPPFGESDHLLRGLLPVHNVRVVATITRTVAREAARRHGAVGGAAAALGRAATAGLLLATITKDRERLTAELQGDGPLGALMVDANADGEVRVYVKNPAAPVAALPGAHVPLSRALGTSGTVRVARDLGLREIVSGHTALQDGEIDTDIEHYLVTSEQVPSVLGCETLLGGDLDPEQSAGLLLQTLPGSEALPFLDQVRKNLRAGALQRALVGPNAAPTGNPAAQDAEALVRALLGPAAHDLLVLDVRPVRFFCPCSKERAAGALSLLSGGELSAMAEEDKGAEVICDFCRAAHRFGRKELDEIRVHAQRVPPS